MSASDPKQTFQMAEVAVPRDLFREILRLIDGLRLSAPVA
jgi:hypothetical protein